MSIKLLFEIPGYQLKNFPLGKSISYKKNGEWKNFSTEEVIDFSTKVSLAFVATGLKKNEKVSIISPSCPEWNFIDIGMLQVGLINVPVYPTISEEEYKYIFNEAEIKMVFVSDENLFKKIKNIQHQIPSLKEIYTFERVSSAKHWTEFLELGHAGNINEIELIKTQIKDTDTATIIYTSGTTGIPKGVMHSHKSIVSNLIAALPLMPVKEKERAFSFLPLCHIFERLLTYLYMTAGLEIYYAENMDKIGENIREVKPHIFTSVPRLLEKVYDKITLKGNDLTGLKRQLFFWALNLGLKYEQNKKNGWWYEFQLLLANKIIFNKWREALGGNLVCIVTGGAALQQRLARVFTAARIVIMEGYGLTEAPATNVNRFNENERIIGTVGPLFGPIEEKLALDGEILIKGDFLMTGYYKNPILTSEVIDADGWFHTGDIGEFVEGKFLKITDRKKEIFKTSGGKYVAPLPIETKLKEILLIEQVMVIGENQKFTAAIISPSIFNLQRWCIKKGLKWTNIEEMIKTPQVKDKYIRELNRINTALGHVEQIKKFELVSDEWSPQTGELTPTMKLKRKVILTKYKNLVEKIYHT